MTKRHVRKLPSHIRVIYCQIIIHCPTLTGYQNIRSFGEILRTLTARFGQLSKQETRNILHFLSVCLSPYRSSDKRVHLDFTYRSSTRHSTETKRKSDGTRFNTRIIIRYRLLGKLLVDSNRPITATARCDGIFCSAPPTISLMAHSI